MAVFLPKRWQQQPQVAVEIDWSNSLARGLVYANLLGPTALSGGIDLVSRRRPTVTGTKPQISRYGRATGFYTTYGVGATDRVTTQSFADMKLTTVSVRAFKLTHGPTFARLWSAGATNGLLNVIVPSAAETQFFRQMTNGSQAQWNVNKQFAEGTWQRTTISMDTSVDLAGAPKFYFDGVSQTVVQVVAPTVGYQAITGSYVFGNRDAGDRIFDGLMLDAFMWARILSDAEARAHHENPYQLLRPINQIFYSLPTGAVTLLPDLVTNNQTFYSPTVARGTVTLQPSLYTNAQTFYSPTVVRGTVTLQPSLYTNGQTFYSPAVARGTVTLQPALYSNGQTFFAPTITGGAVTLLPPLYTNGQTFYSPTVAAGVVTLQPSLYTNTSIFYAPSIAQAQTQTLSPALFVNTNTFFSPSLGDLVFDIYRLLANRQELDPVAGKFRVYKDDDVTVFLEADAWEDAAGTIKYKGGVLRRIDRLEPL